MSELRVVITASEESIREAEQKAIQEMKETLSKE